MWDGGLLTSQKTQTNNYDSQSFSESRLWRLFLGCGHWFLFFCFFSLFGWAHVKMFASHPESFITLGWFPVFCTLFLSCLCVQQNWQEMFCWQMRREECCAGFSHGGSAHRFFSFRLLLCFIFSSMKCHASTCRHVKLKPGEPQTLSDCLLSYRFTLRFARQNVILQEGTIDLLEFPFWNAGV